MDLYVRILYFVRRINFRTGDIRSCPFLASSAVRALAVEAAKASVPRMKTQKMAANITGGKGTTVQHSVNLSKFLIFINYQNYFCLFIHLSMLLPLVCASFFVLVFYFFIFIFKFIHFINFHTQRRL